MTKNLVIVESPAKAKTINKILGGSFVVKASMGHIRDLPLKKLGVDVARNFKPDYVVVKGRERVVQDLAKAAKGCEAIYLAPDPDREGEAIAWHLQAVLGDAAPADKFLRVSYNEITPAAVRHAFAHPTTIDAKLVDAQQARRVLDRLVGYKVSPLLWSRIRGATSAGRVQSVALRLVCEREDQILNFKPEAFWLVGAVVRKQVAPLDAFRIRLVKIDGQPAEIKSAERSEEILKDLSSRPLRVTKVARKEVSRRAPPPFITSTLQQAGSTAHSYSPDRTMRIAQALYEGVDLGDGPVGLITYMRTDSFSISQDAQQSCRAYIAQALGESYLPERPNVYRSRGGAQEAHEAIRPTDVNRTPESLEHKLPSDQLRLYATIWRRFVASQMAPARIEQRTAEIEAGAGDEASRSYLFRATASQVVFDGYMRVSGATAAPPKPKETETEEGEELEVLPPLTEGERLDLLEWLSERKETQPPGRYSEASLIRALEENGVGRPSTYAQIIATLHARNYVSLEKKALRPTPTGVQVCRLLVEHLGQLFDVGFTAEMEKELDDIESGKVDWVRMLADFYGKFSEWLKKAKGPSADPAKVDRLLGALKAVSEWAPEVRSGKRVVSDRKFVESVAKKASQSPGSISERQLQALARVASRYREQGADIQQALADVGMEHIAAEQAPPDPATLRKLELLRSVKCADPVQRGARTYDDRVFIDSLQSQASAGRSLSPAQVRFLDRLLGKYRDQIPDFESVRTELGLGEEPATTDAESGPILDLLKHVTQWKEPVRRGRRVMDDKAFYVSLGQHYAQKHALSVKQLAALKKMAKRYLDQVPEALRGSVAL